jgi:hypothetical protein
MSTQNSKPTSNNYASIKKYISITMGAFYIFIGAMLLITKRFGAFELPNKALSIGLGCLMAIYGGFRLYRAFTNKES